MHYIFNLCAIDPLDPQVITTWHQLPVLKVQKQAPGIMHYNAQLIAHTPDVLPAQNLQPAMR